MGEFPEPAIWGSTAPATSAATTTPPISNEPAQSIDAGPATSRETRDGSEEASVTPSWMRTTTRTAMSMSRPSNTKTTQPQPVETNPDVTTSTSAQAVYSSIPTSTMVIQTRSIQLVTPTLASTPISTALSRSNVLSSASTSTGTNSQILSTPSIATRPIVTPTLTATFVPTPETLAANSQLSLGAIVGVVATVLLLIGVSGTCIILGPRRILRKLGSSANRDEKIGYEEWEEAHKNSVVWSGGRPASIGANSDWWRAPAGAFASRHSTVSMGGPGMAGVGAGRHMELADPAPTARRVSQRRVEERRTVRSGWFSANMVRGASLLSLGSLVRSPNESSGGAEQMDRLGAGGSAGKRFQELYRRERAQQQGTLAEPSITSRARTQAPVSEMSERRMSERRTRAVTPKARRPSRLAESYVPEIVVHDATHPSLSSVSNVTHESAGRGYDADAEVEPRRARVF